MLRDLKKYNVEAIDDIENVDNVDTVENVLTFF